MIKENDNEDDRIIFRPSEDQKKKIKKLMLTGKYRTLSELYRQLFTIGLKNKLKE